MLLTQREVAERFRCSVQTVARLRKSGDLKAINTKPILFEEEEVNRLLCKLKKEETYIICTTGVPKKSLPRRADVITQSD